jgi:hypothetical protein
MHFASLRVDKVITALTTARLTGWNQPARTQGHFASLRSDKCGQITKVLYFRTFNAKRVRLKWNRFTKLVLS